MWVGRAGVRVSEAKKLRAALDVLGLQSAATDGGGRSRWAGGSSHGWSPSFPMVGGVVSGTLKPPEKQVSRHSKTVLEPHHRNSVIVPGVRWGAESPWIARTACVLAGALSRVLGGV